METIFRILHDLGVDSTFFIQFSIFVVTLPVMHFLFMKKLRFVIEHREEKTVKEEQNADRMLETALELEEKYRKKIDDGYDNAQKLLGDRRRRVMREEMEKYRSVETEVDFFLEKSRSESLKEVEEKRKQVLMDADFLAGDLVNKLAM